MSRRVPSALYELTGMSRSWSPNFRTAFRASLVDFFAVRTGRAGGFEAAKRPCGSAAGFAAGSRLCAAGGDKRRHQDGLLRHRRLPAQQLGPREAGRRRQLLGSCGGLLSFNKRLLRRGGLLRFDARLLGRAKGTSIGREPRLCGIHGGPPTTNGRSSAAGNSAGTPTAITPANAIKAAAVSECRREYNAISFGCTSGAVDTPSRATAP
jgi:hypothetical protein